MMELVLASASPRRLELMNMLGFEDLTVLPAVGEENVDLSQPPHEIVRQLAMNKAVEVSLRCEGHPLIVAADTIVWYNNKVYGKPVDEEDAFRMLRSLSGNTHSVFTGVAVLGSGGLDLRSEESRVTFREMSDEEIRGYIATGEPMDKAGAYGVQGRGAVFVEHLDGDFFNVMGLPLCTLAQMLKQQGVKVF